jgi:hypothetical protein
MEEAPANQNKMTWLYTLLEHAPPADRLARIIAGLRVIGGLGLVLLGMYFVIQDAYLEATLSVVQRCHHAGTLKKISGASHRGSLTFFNNFAVLSSSAKT